jgi:hypothetical protein
LAGIARLAIALHPDIREVIVPAIVFAVVLALFLLAGKDDSCVHLGRDIHEHAHKTQCPNCRAG